MTIDLVDRTKPIVDFDTKLFLYLNNLGIKELDGIWTAFSNEYFWIPLYAILLYLVYRNYKLKNTLVIMVIIVLMIFLGETISMFVKETVQRPRPCKNQELLGHFRMVYGVCRGNFCFFSAHASNTFSLAIFLTLVLRRYYKYIGIILISWAGLVSVSRIYMGVHFPLDIAVGTIFGICMGTLHYYLFRFIKTKFINK